MFLFLLLIWIVFNGKITLEILLFGIGVSAAVCMFLSRTMDYKFRNELKLIRIIPDAVAYIAVLLVEIIKSNFTVMKLVKKGEKELEPVVCHFNSHLKSSMSRVILANSITITPGTITVSLKDDEFWVHCLDKSVAEGIESSVFVKRLMTIEKKTGVEAGN